MYTGNGDKKRIGDSVLHRMENVACQTDAQSPKVETVTQKSATSALPIQNSNVTARPSFVRFADTKDWPEALRNLTEEYVRRVLETAGGNDYRNIPNHVKINTMSVDSPAPPLFSVPNDNRPYVYVTVNEIECLPLLDTGAMVCIIGYVDESEIEPFNAPIESCPYTISTLDGAQYSTNGLMWLRYCMGNRQAVLPTVVIKTDKSQFIVGMTFWEAFQMKIVWDSPAGVKSSAVSKIDTTKTNPLSAELANPILSVKMLSVSQHGVMNRQQSGNGKIVNWQSRINEMRPWPQTSDRQLEAPIIHSNETETEEIEPIVPYFSKQITAPKEYQAAPVHLMLDLLRNMPTNNVQIGTMTAQQGIKTAAGAHDASLDIMPQKHTCVSEPHTLTAEQSEILATVMREFPYTPTEGPLNCTHVYTQRINTGTATPEMRKQYPLSPYVMDEIGKELTHLIERDIIEPIDFSPWRWPILWVRKKAGGGRICVDARGLNKLTVPDAYPTLNVDTILRNLPKAKYISGLDMTQAFHQIPIAEEDRIKTSFAVGHKFYRYKRAIMGFRNSPADLAKLLDKIFGDLMPKVYHYVDDFIILSATFEEHVELLRKVAKRLCEANLSISREKSSFCYKRVTFLGYVLTDRGLEANPERIQPILDYKRPTTIKELRRLIGLVGWYRRFLYNAAEIIGPLTNLTRGETRKTIEWNDEAEQAFIRVKQALTSSAVLAAPDYSLPFRVYTDASLTAGAAILTQIQNDEEKVIAYHSVKFSPTQQNYSATERECLAVLSGVEKFRPYIDGVTFTVVTDHSSLRWLQNLREPHGKLARWAVRLQAFSIIFEHRPGRQMAAPDALSRSIDVIEIETPVKTDDKWYKKMFQMTNGGGAARYKIENDILYHLGRFDCATGERRWNICVPNECINAVLNEKHDDLSHGGFWKTWKLVKKLYYWPNMAKDVHEYVGKCVTCKQIKSSNENTRVETGKYRDPKAVGRVFSVDLIGPLPASKLHKHQWVIVCIDAFSRYMFTKACTRATSNVVADFLEKDVFYKFQTPEKIVTDNGKQFISQWFEQFLSTHGIQHELTPVYHPQANQVEATNKCVKTSLRAQLLAKADHTDWSSYLQKITMHLNTTPRMPTGQSPYFVVFGYEKCQSGKEHRLVVDANEPVDASEDRRELIYEQVAEEQRAAFEQNKRRYNLRTTVRKFKPNDQVFIKNPKQSSAGDSYAQKLAPLKQILFVKEPVENSSDMYVLMDGHGKTVGTYHASQIYSR